MATDVGGTFTDIVWVDEITGEIRADKAQTTPRDVVRGVLDATAKTAVPPAEIGMFVHGSTVATNALIVKSGGKTGLITTKGFRDSLEIRRVNRPDEHIYNIFWRKPEPLVPRRLRLEISARMRFTGEEISPVVRAEVEEAIATFRAAGVETVVVCLLHAYADPKHEVAVREIIGELWPEVYVSLSHEVAREIREYERVSSTSIDGYVKKPVVGYLRRLRTALVDDVGVGSDPLIANSAGGVSTVETIERAPIQMIASGPAGGAIGAAYLAGQIGLPNLVTADVGGTSYDVSLVVDGKTVLRTEHDVLGYAAKVSSVDVRSVGAGGGSIAWVDEGGLLHVGPGSAGADPGPMCYGKGGTRPTVTDAAVVAGLIDPARFAGGEIALDVALAEQGIGEIAAALGLSPLAAAEGIVTIARNNMANVTRQILVGQGYDPRDFALLSFGGGGGLFASEVARSLDIPTVVVPVHPAAFSAWGMLSADIVGSFARSYVRPVDGLDPAAVERLFAEMERDAAGLMTDAKIASEQIVLERSVDARYEGQGHEVEVPLSGVGLDGGLAEALSARFDELHEVRYGHRMESPRQTVTFRLRAFGQMQKLRLDDLAPGNGDISGALKGRRDVYLMGATRDCGVYDRALLRAGDTISGPAIVEEPSHVTIILPGDELTVDRVGNLVIAVGKSMTASSTSAETGGTVDPITVAVVHNALTTAAREMRDTIQRTAFSPVIYEDRDFACGLLDAEGATMAEAPGLTAFMGTLSPCWQKCRQSLDVAALQPGDVVIVALPDYTGSHPADMALFMPIFHDGRLFGFAASKAHLIDVGAKDPYPTDSTDAFQEGLRLPPVKLYRGGVLNEEIGGIIRANSRAPESIWGDIHAEIACFRVGDQACQRLLAKYGFDTVVACVNQTYDHAERMARAAIRKMPAGTWSADDQMDDNGVERGVPVPIHVAVTIDPETEEITFDFSKSASQQRGPTNAPLVGTISISRMMGKILTTPEMAANEGSFRPIKVIAPAGSIFNASSTAPTNLYGWPEMNAVETIIHALGEVFPDKLPAGSGGDLCGVLRYGFDATTGKMWYEANIEGIGQGASSTADGESAMVHISEACSRNLPVEIEETHDPVLVERYELIPDSGGAGRFRGGLGVRRDTRLGTDARIISTMERGTSPHWGVAGGQPGLRNFAILESSIHGVIEILKLPDTPMAAGDLIAIHAGGGGGYGDPFTRDPDAVLHDVIDGYVTPEAARTHYGVAIDGESINEAETARLRAGR